MNKPNRWRLGYAAFWGMAFAVATDMVAGGNTIFHAIRSAATDRIFMDPVMWILGNLAGGVIPFVLFAAARNGIITAIWRRRMAKP